MTHDPYHDRTEVSATDLRRAAERGGWYAIWCRHNPRTSKAMETGTRIHQAMLEPETFDLSRYVCKPDGMSFATKEGKAWKADAEAAGLTIVDATEWQLYANIGGLLTDWHALLRSVPGVWKFEEPVIWQHASGIDCRCKPDAVCYDPATDTVTLYSVKTTGKPVTADDWCAQVESRISQRADGTARILPGYDLGERHYAEGLAQHYLGDSARWPEIRISHIVVPTDGPMCLYVAPVPPALLHRIGDAYEALLQEVAEAGVQYPENVPSGIMLLEYQPSVWAQRGGAA